ncbi:MAG TPA: enoyl-CoA hydratase/isomerase family protein [Sphingomonas sp.]|jgi:enoyl-CoA hydratase/carnithine racemase|uniref:enoyl-CoA hydratase/isomerase family protein n=1 Tax=Sphingomonas sp. TaxID=28214 RepID=UPI002ED7BAFB
MIGYDVQEGVATVSLDRATARNAVPIADWDTLARTIGAAAGQARVILLRSAVPGTFCAGADLGEFAAMMADPALVARFRRAMAGAMTAVADAAVPVIAAIDGGCFGAGVALAMACDLRIAGAEAAFAIPPARLGISYPAGDIQRLRTLVGPGQAARLLLTGDRIDAAEAARIGLVELSVPNAKPVGREMAARIAANSGASVAALRAVLRGQEDGDARFDALFAGPDLRTRFTRR